jgi:signal transduction histidine kinase
MLWLAFAAVVGSFFAASIIVQRSSTAVGELSEQIIYNSAPSIERLATFRRSILEAELALSRFIHEPAARSGTAASIDEALARGNQSAREYLTLPAFASEQNLMRDVQASWLAFEGAARRARDFAASNATAKAVEVFADGVQPARQRVLEDVTRAIELNAFESRQLAGDIRQTRQRTVRLAHGLDALCALLAVLVAWLLHRQTRARRALREAYTNAVEMRAAELERFSGRVAHDIRNPLSAARMGAELVLRKTTGDDVHATTNRIIRSLSRAEAITSALLDFARSGAKPDPGARTDVRAVLADVLGGLAPEAERSGIELHCDPVPPVLVACSTGVYLSLVGNLVANAMKYMGDGQMKRIEVRVSERGASVRTEVSDTGPGIPAGALPSLFEPYFRAQSSGEGLGLGLATVKKLAESHGGAIGVASVVGKGSVFWFDLPRAGSSESMIDPGPHAVAQANLRH